MHKFVQAAHVAYEFITRAKIKMIGIAQYQRGIDLFEMLGCEGFDRSLCADRREDRRDKVAVWGGEEARAGAVAFRGDIELEHRADYTG